MSGARTIFVFFLLTFQCAVGLQLLAARVMGAGDFQNILKSNLGATDFAPASGE